VSIRLSCPSCLTYVTLDEEFHSMRCRACHAWLHAVECDSCRHVFVGLDGPQVCPKCGHAVSLADARLGTFGDARDPETGLVLVIEQRGSGKLHRGDQDDRSTVRFLVRFFSALCWITIFSGIAMTMLVDEHLGSFPNSRGVVAFATFCGIAATTIVAALLAFCSYTLELLLELVERPSPGVQTPIEGMAESETGD
jgi:hypothetical protein